MMNVKDQWLDLARLRLLVDILHEVTLTLDSTKGNLANLLGIKVFPGLIVQVFEEGNNVHWINKVDESVPDIAAIVKVQRQVEKVISALVMPVNALQEHLLSVLVRDVPNHNRSASVLTPKDSVQIDGEFRIGRALLFEVVAPIDLLFVVNDVIADCTVGCAINL